MSEAFAELGPRPGDVPAQTPSPPPLDAGAALYLKMVMGGLKAVKSAAIADWHFIRDTCHLHPRRLSEAQRAHVMRLAWRYRFDLRSFLRPERDPDTNPDQKAQ